MCGLLLFKGDVHAGFIAGLLDKSIGDPEAGAEEQGITQGDAEQNFLKAMHPTTLINRFTTTEEVANAPLRRI